MKARRCVIYIISSLILALVLSSSEFISPVGVAGAPLIATCTPDPPGESDNPNNAITVCDGQTVTGRVDDIDRDDVYKIYALANQTLTISMSGTGVGGPGDADLYLYPPGTFDVDFDAPANDGNDEFIQYTVSQDGFWYIDVYDYNNGDSGTDYSVTVTLSSSSTPVAPSNLTATPVSQTQVNLSWQDNSTDETGFNIERSLNGSTGWTQVATVAANATTYTNTSLLCGTTYYYRAQAVNSGGSSAYSNIEGAETLSCPTIFLPIIIKSPPPPPVCVPDPPGESDNINDALTVCDGQTVTGRVDDIDWDDVYKIYVLANQTITLSMSGTGVGGPGDADLFLYPPGTTDVDFDTEADFSDNYGNNEFIQYTVSQEGYWYIDVYDYDDGDGGTDYSVTVTLSGVGSADVKTYETANPGQKHMRDKLKAKGRR